MAGDAPAVFAAAYQAQCEALCCLAAEVKQLNGNAIPEADSVSPVQEEEASPRPSVQLRSNGSILQDTVLTSNPSILRCSGVCFTEKGATAMIAALQQSSMLATVKELHFVNCEFAVKKQLAELLDLIAEHCAQLRTLSIDGCGIEPIMVSQLLAIASLDNISLRCNALGDGACADIADTLKKNKSLVRLNLFGNCITCEGAIKLANALRTNRTLTALDLGANKISDQGLLKLLVPLTDFELTDEEVVVKRKVAAALADEQDTRPGGTSSKGQRGKKPGTAKKSSAKSPATARRAKSPSAKQTKTTSGTADDVGASQSHPFLHNLRKTSENRWIVGRNSSLVVLNLSDNQFSSDAVQAVVDRLERFINTPSYSEDENEDTQQKPPAAVAASLCRVIVGRKTGRVTAIVPDQLQNTVL